MGEYLSKPDRTKATESGENQQVSIVTLLWESSRKSNHSLQLRYVATGIQGWRRSMEDSHITNTNLGNGLSFFGVFDGHGGKLANLSVFHIFER